MSENLGLLVISYGGSEREGKRGANRRSPPLLLGVLDTGLFGKLDYDVTNVSERNKIKYGPSRPNKALY